jgi:hypothetical protein
VTVAIPPETKSFEAFQALLDTLREVAATPVAGGGNGVAERDVVEGIRHLGHLVSAGVDFYLEGDPERPAFTRMVSPTRKFLGDNPDALYHFARIRGDRAYRITGRKGDECYFSLSVHGRAPDGRIGGASEPVLADVNDRNLEVAADGRFEILLIPEGDLAEPPARRGEPHPAPVPINRVPLGSSAVSVITRHYWERPRAPAADPAVRVELGIEPLEAPPPPPPLSDAVLAGRLQDLRAFVRSATVDRFDPPAQLPFVSTTPNELGTPTVFRMAGAAAWGAVDIAYAMGPFRLDDDEALLMECRLPECAFANVVLWNRNMQTFDYRHRRVSLNRAQAKREPDGSCRIVVAHRDPGLPNWLDTEGHREGLIFWRYILPETDPEKPRCSVLRLSSEAPT